MPNIDTPEDRAERLEALGYLLWSAPLWKDPAKIRGAVAHIMYGPIDHEE